MKSKLLTLLLITFLVSCSTRDFQKEIEHLDGYWQIERVIFPDGTEKEFSISTTIDYIEVEESNKGFRKKVNPKLDGSFVTSDSEEFFTIETSENELLLHYTTEFDTWTETILSSEENKLVIKNRDDKVYHYKRFSKFELDI
ncbi:hypothetical protein ACFQO1_07395 [Jejudonia soesokkakensis]|uniref:Lipocalin-like domain-containing protein n=1 Tax=Jejudonia soesokkakensis TaxID=1323432 RepID=A0ABW2MTT0_9FLAO